MPHATLEARRNYLREWKHRNPTKVAGYAKQDRARHPERFRMHDRRHRAANLQSEREKDRVQAAERRKARPDVQKEIRSRATLRRLQRQEAAAGRVKPNHCEICGELHRYVCFDHDHATGKFRGWLCDRCNKVLGLVYDSAPLLVQLARYLETHNGES